MDFYDDFGKRSKQKTKSSFLTHLMSGIIGGLIVILLLPTLINAGIVDISAENNGNSPTVENGQGNGSENKEVNVDVTTGIVEAVEKVKPAVVGVVNIQEQSNFWTRQTTDVEAGVGTGVVFEIKNGKAYIVTNNHVIKGAKDIEVALSNGERVSAELLGGDELTDLAVIAIDEKYADTVAPLGNSNNLKHGEPAIAIGNPLGLEFSQSVTVGVISSNNRTIGKDLNGDGLSDWDTEVIQTDAAINPGNSGGPLINIAGEVIGINSAKISESGVEGLGFAIPISDAKPYMDELIEYGKIRRPYMGITPYDLHNVSQQDRQNVLKIPESINDGVVLADIYEFGPSTKAGLKKYDVIVKLDDQVVKNSADLRKYLYKEKKVGEELEVTYYREGKLEKLTMTLTEFKIEQ